MSKATKTKAKEQAVKSNTNKNPLNQEIVPSLKLSLFIVFIVPVILYIQSLQYGFVGFDDDMILANNSQFFSKLSNIPKAFTIDALTTKQSLFYRPMQTISYIIDAQISGVDKTWMFHFSNVLLLGCIGCALFLLLRKFQIPHKLAIVSTLIYCAHPLFVSSVAWIPACGDLQLTLFSLLAIILFIEYQENGKPQHLAIHFVAYTIALFCKETAAMLPVLFALYIIFLTDKKLFEKKHIAIFSLYAVIGLLWFGMRMNAVVKVADSEDHVGISSMFTMIKTIPESLTKFFIPFNIAPIPNFSILKTGLGLLLLAGIVLLFFKTVKNLQKEKIFSLVWFFIFIVPTLFFKHTLIDYLDHRFFLPLIGIVIFILISIPKNWIEQLNGKKLWMLMLIFVGLASNTFFKSKAYANQTTFWDEAAAKNQESCLIFYNRGCMKINPNGAQGQVEEYTKALAVKPDYFLAYLNRGSAYSELGKYDSAIADYAKVIKLKPNDADAYYNRGYTYRQMKNDEQALKDYTKAIELNPDFYSALLNRANTYNFFKQYDKAIADYRRTMQLRPESVEPYYFRGIIYIQKGMIDSAIADYTKAIEVKPDFADVYYNRGNAYNTKGMADKAIEDYSKAISLKADYGDALNNRGITYLNKGQKDLACADFKRASDLGVKAAQSNSTLLCK